MENISKFNGSPVLLKMTKYRSPVSILFIPEEKDPFLINVIYCKNTGTITSECMILRPDLEARIQACRKNGFMPLNTEAH
jgi:hypothetical protein